MCFISHLKLHIGHEMDYTKGNKSDSVVGVQKLEGTLKEKLTNNARAEIMTKIFPSFSK